MSEQKISRFAWAAVVIVASLLYFGPNIALFFIAAITFGAFVGVWLEERRAKQDAVLPEDGIIQNNCCPYPNNADVCKRFFEIESPASTQTTNSSSKIAASPEIGPPSL